MSTIRLLIIQEKKGKEENQWEISYRFYQKNGGGFQIQELQTIM